MGARDGRGNFFAIDSRIWVPVTGCGLNPPAAYLVLACGTDKDNRVSRWSTNAVMNHAGMGWERAKSAVDNLVTRSFVRRATSATSGKPLAKGGPQFELASFAEWWNLEAARDSGDLLIVNDIRQGKQPTYKHKDARNRSESLLHRGLLVRDTNGLYCIPEGAESDSGESLIWLPNAIVTGTSNGEESPVRRLRGAGCPWTLRLFVDLYSAHNLRDDGGISPRVVSQEYERRRVGEQGGYTVWAFKPRQKFLHWSGPLDAHRGRAKTADGDAAIWESIRTLEGQGLLSFVPHIFENSTDDAEPIHVYGLGCKEYAIDPIERQIGEAANEAGVSMCLPTRMDSASRDGFWYLCPIRSTLPDAQMIGVARLTYRPHTRRTAAWSANLHQTGPGLIESFRQLTAKAETAQRRRETKSA